MDEQIQTLQDARKEVQEQIDQAMDDPTSKSTMAEKRAQMASFKKTKTTLIDEKKALRAQLDRLKTDNDKLLKDKKDARSNARFGSVQDIDKEIAKLQKLQETTSMSLTEEKKLIKEMDALQASKKFVTDIKSKDAALDDMRVQRKALAEQISAKDKEIDAVSAEMDAIVKAMKELDEAHQTKRDAKKELFTKRDAVRKEINDLFTQKDVKRDAFRTANNAWFTYQRAIKAQKKMQYEEEKAKREAERAEYQAKLEAEEAKKIPYEEEQALCDFLANYLERTYLDAPADGEDKTKDAATAATTRVPDDDPFAGLTPVNKKAEEDYFGKAGGKKKKRVRAAKKQDLVTERPFTLSVDTFEQFGMLQLDPPVKLEDVAQSVQALREKKAWYQQQPRGSVPTAQEIRKRKEQANRQPSSSDETNGKEGDERNNNTTKKKAATKKGGKFQLNANDFVPLGSKEGGGASSATASTTWGPPPKDAAATTEDAAAEPLATDGAEATA